MQLDEYQSRANGTAIYPASVRLLYPCLGLAGEAGEVCDKVKKIFRDEGGVIEPEKRQEILKELGDVLWYIAAIARDLDADLSSVAAMNLQKLESRQARGVLGGSGDNR